MKIKAPKTGEKSPSTQHKASTTAHLIETTGHHLAHTKRHLDNLNRPKTPKAKALDLDHASTHLNGGIEHVQKLMDHVKSNYPSEGKELSKLEDTVPHTAKERIHQAVKKHKEK